MGRRKIISDETKRRRIKVNGGKNFSKVVKAEPRKCTRAAQYNGFMQRYRRELLAYIRKAYDQTEALSGVVFLLIPGSSENVNNLEERTYTENRKIDKIGGLVCKVDFPRTTTGRYAITINYKPIPISEECKMSYLEKSLVSLGTKFTAKDGTNFDLIYMPTNCFEFLKIK